MKSADGRFKIPDGGTLRVAVSGKSGCGNTTVTGMLAEALGVPMINYTFRQLASESNLTLEEVIERAKTDDSFDKYVDSKQVELAMRGSCALGSRLAIWMLKEADAKIYLAADDDTRARRIQAREGGDMEKVKAFTAMRDGEDTRRYKALYGIDNNDYASVADLVIDAAAETAEKIVERILAHLERRGLVERER